MIHALTFAVTLAVLAALCTWGKCYLQRNEARMDAALQRRPIPPHE